MHDIYNNPIVFNEKSYYTRNSDKNAVDFKFLKLQIPVNSKYLKAKYPYTYEKIYLQFKFTVKTKEETNIEILGWFNHKFFNSEGEIN